MSKIFRKVAIIAIAMVMLFGTLAIATGCGASVYGIPLGHYFQVDQDGNAVPGGSREGGWSIRWNRTERRYEAEHRYLVFDIVKENDRLFFEFYREPSMWSTEYTTGLFRYEVKFCTETRTLTVYMPSVSGTPSSSSTRNIP